MAQACADQNSTATPVSEATLPTSVKSRHSFLPRIRLADMAGRYSLTAIGPIAVSAAHFAASVLFLHKLEPVEFGLFSFVLVVVPFAQSISSGLLGAPMLSAVGKSEVAAEAERAALRDVNRFYCLAAGIVTAILIWFSGAGAACSLLLGAFGAVMTFRWFSRYHAYYGGKAALSSASDLVYSAVLLLGLALLFATDQLSLPRTSMVLLMSALVSLSPFGSTYLQEQVAAPFSDFRRVFGSMWHDVVRWSLMGVVLSEMTANAHAYLVTAAPGAQAFALLAAGSLMMRPLALVLNALPERERPAMALCLSRNDIPGAFRMINEFRTAATAMWLATVGLSAVILVWFPHLVVRSGFDPRSVEIVVAIWMGIGAARAVRSPETAFLLAAGQFGPLARAGMAGGLVSLGATLVLLVLFGPVISLLGILAGETAMSLRVGGLMRSWRRAHG